ncbi:helix-turn-helix domain-containing protein [Bifidobacterium callitrichidarum]|uniref:Helix-turn-helix domain-containing protein n=1 Tax=Bifidobacterium callitrichidarum TaxID=2052941 RepID=A0A2U2NC35_9BIFI|nr:helix-turn-helix domain-containing protein [Bifidobacterium callitrichidarum]PWG66716.1 hypothetical protein DF196_02095 [Bifidobacterium callitrichidarum]
MTLCIAEPETISEKDKTIVFNMLEQFDNDSAVKNVLAELVSDPNASIATIQKDITPNQAAKILNVSRPHATLLMKSGAIPSYKVGTNWRTTLKAVEDYAQEREQTKLDYVAAQYSRDQDIKEALNSTKIQAEAERLYSET